MVLDQQAGVAHRRLGARHGHSAVDSGTAGPRRDRVSVVDIGLLNPTHILVVALVVLVVFGPRRLPELGRSLGRGMREFRDSISGDQDHLAASQPPPDQRGEDIVGHQGEPQR